MLTGKIEYIVAKLVINTGILVMNPDKYLNYSWKYKQEDMKYCPRCSSSFKLQDLHIVDQPQLVCDVCKFVFYLDPKVVVAAVVLNATRDGILLLKRAEEPGKGKWCFPGGHVSRGESIEAAICNEVQEEAGLIFSIESILDFSDLPGNQGIQITFLGKTQTLQPQPNIESTEACFFSIDQIPWDSLAFAATTSSLKKIIPRL